MSRFSSQLPPYFSFYPRPFLLPAFHFLSLSSSIFSARLSPCLFLYFLLLVLYSPLFFSNFHRTFTLLFFLARSTPSSSAFTFHFLPRFFLVFYYFILYPSLPPCHFFHLLVFHSLFPLSFSFYSFTRSREFALSLFCQRRSPATFLSL